jgi:putative FmdB family regulatory protein
VPTYEYRCTDCGHRFDAVQSIHDPALTACPVCGGPIRRLFGTVGVVFKGSGFYRTDSREKVGARAASGEGDSKDGSSAESGKDSGKDGKQSSGKPADGGSSGGGGANGSSGSGSQGSDSGSGSGSPKSAEPRPTTKRGDRSPSSSGSSATAKNST